MCLPTHRPRHTECSTWRGARMHMVPVRGHADVVACLCAGCKLRGTIPGQTESIGRLPWPPRTALDSPRSVPACVKVTVPRALLELFARPSPPPSLCRPLEGLPAIYRAPRPCWLNSTSPESIICPKLQAFCFSALSHCISTPSAASPRPRGHLPTSPQLPPPLSPLSPPRALPPLRLSVVRRALVA